MQKIKENLLLYSEVPDVVKLEVEKIISASKCTAD